MDTQNNFQMPSKQYLEESSEHQLESWHPASPSALLPAVCQADSHVCRRCKCCMSGWTRGFEAHQGPNPAKLRCLGLHYGKQAVKSLTGLHNTHNLSIPPEHSCASPRGETASHSEHESDVFLWNTFLNYWHNQFIISEIHVRTWRCWDSV